MGDRPDSGPIVINGGGGGDGGGGSDSGSTSGGSSTGGSAPAAPPVDPIVARRESMFQQLYMQLWGEPATEAYIKSAANSGLNSWEFAAREKAKPEWSQTEAYKKQAQSLADMIRGWGIA